MIREIIKAGLVFSTALTVMNCMNTDTAITGSSDQAEGTVNPLFHTDNNQTYLHFINLSPTLSSGSSHKEVIIDGVYSPNPDKFTPKKLNGVTSGYIEYPFSVPVAGSYYFWIKAYMAKDAGIYEVSIDGVKQKFNLDMYKTIPAGGYASQNEATFYLDFKTITAGNHKIRFTYVGKNSLSTNTFLYGQSLWWAEAISNKVFTETFESGLLTTNNWTANKNLISTSPIFGKYSVKLVNGDYLEKTITEISTYLNGFCGISLSARSKNFMATDSLFLETSVDGATWTKVKGFPLRNSTEPMVLDGDLYTELNHTLKVRLKVVAAAGSAGYVNLDNIRFIQGDKKATCLNEQFEAGSFATAGWTSVGAAISNTVKYWGTYSALLNGQDAISKNYTVANTPGVQNYGQELVFFLRIKTVGLQLADNFTIETIDGTKIYTKTISGTQNGGNWMSLRFAAQGGEETPIVPAGSYPFKIKTNFVTSGAKLYVDDIVMFQEP